MTYIFNPINDKTPQGAVLAGTTVTYTIKVSRFSQCGSLFFVLTDDSDNSLKKIKMPLYACDESYYTYSISITYKTAGLFWYYFEATDFDRITYLCKTPLFDTEPSDKLGESFAQIIYEKPATVNDNYNNGIIYHIFVDRFKKSGKTAGKEGMILRSDWGGEITKNSKDFLIINQECFGGNLQGIIDKLPYIKSLGTTTIFLSPVFESYSYHKYDVADYEQVDSMFGGTEALNKLVEEAKKFDIGILLDGVFNHVGSDSVYFNKLGRFKTTGAFQSEKSKYYDWFTFTKFPDKYSCWWGIDTLPQFNEDNPQLQQYIAGNGGIIEKYIKTGILGFRLDVVDELSDGYLNKICAQIKRSNPFALVLGEVWEDAAIKTAYNKRRSYFRGNQLDSVMNYPLKNAITEFVTHGNAESLAAAFYMLKDHYPKEVQHNLMNFLGTHDTKRILTVLEESVKNNKQQTALRLLKIASTIQYCAPGVPAVFYGDEAGVLGGDAPFCRICFPWGNENKEILAWYKKLGKLRSSRLFTDGESNVLLAHNGVFIFERKNNQTRTVIAANCGTEDFKLNLRIPMINFETGKTEKNFIMLHADDFVILTSKNKGEEL